VNHLIEYEQKTGNTNIDYLKEGTDIRTIYTIEYIDNEKDFNAIEKHSAPWELYKTKKTESLQRAIEIFFALYTAQRDETRHIYDVKLFEAIQLNGETIREQYITGMHNFTSLLGRESVRISNQYDDLKENYEKLQKRIDDFTCRYNAKKAWYNHLTESAELEMKGAYNQ
jgi:hypothetical protein